MSNSAVRRESSLKHVSGELPIKADIDTEKTVGRGIPRQVLSTKFLTPPI